MAIKFVFASLAEQCGLAVNRIRKGADSAPFFSLSETAWEGSYSRHAPSLE